MATDTALPITEEAVQTAVDQLTTWEQETQPQVDKFLEDNKNRLTSEPDEVLKEMEGFLVEFSETIGIAKNSEAPIVRIAGDPIQAALQLRGFYIGILTARVVANGEA